MVITSLAACSVDLSPSALAIAYLSSLVSSPSSLVVSDASSLHGMEHDIIWRHLLDSPLALLASGSSFAPKFPPYDLSKEPLSYTEALARPDADEEHCALLTRIRFLRLSNV